jgi:hypothetical protein
MHCDCDAQFMIFHIMVRKIVLVNRVIQRFFLRLIIHACFAMLYFDFIFHSDELSIDNNELIFQFETHIREQLSSQKITKGK